jgi:hypothetical protein
MPAPRGGSRPPASTPSFCSHPTCHTERNKEPVSRLHNQFDELRLGAGACKAREFTGVRRGSPAGSRVCLGQLLNQLLSNFKSRAGQTLRFPHQCLRTSFRKRAWNEQRERTSFYSLCGLTPLKVHQNYPRLPSYK